MQVRQWVGLELERTQYFPSNRYRAVPGSITYLSALSLQVVLGYPVSQASAVHRVVMLFSLSINTVPLCVGHGQFLSDSFGGAGAVMGPSRRRRRLEPSVVI